MSDQKSFCKCSLRKFVEDMVDEANTAVLGLMKGERKLDGVLLIGDSYREMVYEKLTDEGHVVFYEGDLILYNVKLYEIDLNELFDIYRRNGNLDESEFGALANGLERTLI